jgi:hypothetical protein
LKSEKAAASQVANQAELMEEAFEARAMKKPAAKEPQPKIAASSKVAPESKLNKDSKTKPVKKDPEHKMDWKNLHSRTYTAAKLCFIQEGHKLEIACEKAHKVVADDLSMASGFEPHPNKKRQTRTRSEP